MNNIHIIRNKRWTAKIVALLLTAALVATVIAVNLGASLAAPSDLTVTLNSESGISAANEIEVGSSKTLGVSYLFEAYSTDTSKAAVAYTPGTGLDNIRTTGVSAGVASVTYGTQRGVISVVRYQIIDSNNISAYTLKDGGEVYFTGPNITKTNLVTATGFLNRITWSSMNTSVATVDASGSITSKGIGATVVIGSFIDKWGVPRDMHLLVGVGVRLSDSDRSRLLELIQKGEAILADNPDQYTSDSLHDLEDAIAAGKAVINSTDPSDQAINDAIDGLQNAINGMEKKQTTPPGVLGPDNDGNYYKPVGDPENVYEVVDENGGSLQPPEYVYNPDGDPVNKTDKNRPAYHKDGSYYVEDPTGSNIYKKVNGDGTLKDDPAVWGGPDGQFGGGDDQAVNKFGNDYWIGLGQNIWQKVNQGRPTELDPTLYGGGPDENPATDPVTPIYKHDDKYYVGPLPPGASNGYYYGDKLTGGDGKVNSTATNMHPSDEKFYLVNGNMVPESDLTGIPGLEGTPDGGTIVIDGVEWTKVKTDSTGKYAMLLLNDLIGPFQYHNVIGFNSEYTAAYIRYNVDGWYYGLNSPLLKQFQHSAMIGTDDYMSWPYAGSGSGTGIYAFIPKKSDLAGLTPAKRDLGQPYWTATRTMPDGQTVGYQTTVIAGGEWGVKEVTQSLKVRPAIWVQVK